MERANFHMPEEERHKAMFTTKYDLARPLCRCACGKGYLRPRLNGRANVVRVGDDPAPGGAAAGLSAADLEKKKMHEAKLALKAKQACTPQIVMARAGTTDASHFDTALLEEQDAMGFGYGQFVEFIRTEVDSFFRQSS